MSREAMVFETASRAPLYDARLLQPTTRWQFRAEQQERKVSGWVGRASVVDTGRTAPSTSRANNRAGEGPADKALARLREFKTWGEGWDGEGAPRPDPASLETAIRLLALLAPFRTEFAADMDADSRPLFHLRGSAFEGGITVDDPQTVSFSLRHGAELIDDYAASFDGHAIPEKLAAALRIV